MDILRKHAKIGIVHFMAYPQVMRGDGPVLETLSTLIEDDYFDAVEVTRIQDAGIAREAARMLESARIAVAFGAQPVLLGNKLNLNATDDSERKKAVEAVAACFDQAALLHAVGVAVLAGPWSPGKERIAQEVLVDSLVALATKAKPYGLRLILEVFDDAIDKRALVGKASVARSVAENVCAQCDNFGLMHDLSHLPLLGESPSEALTPIRKFLVHAHIGNAVTVPNMAGYGDQHPRFGIPGGRNDVAEVAAFIKTLYAIGFFGGNERRFLSFEVKPFPGEKSEEVIAGAKRVLNEAMTRLDMEIDKTG